MQNVLNVGLGNNQVIPMVKQKQGNSYAMNFKAGEVDQYVRGGASRPQMSQDEAMMQMIKQRQAEQKKAQRKQKWMTGLQIAGVISGIALAGFFIWQGTKGNNDKKVKDLTEQIKKIKDIGIKREAEEEMARQSYERSLYRVQDLINLDDLAHKVEERTPANIEAVKKRLDSEIIGMDEAKKPIIDFLEALNYDIKNGVNADKPIILAMDGPPGTGKTSLMKVIADALGMHFEKISLSSTKNMEAITGFERTYAGATPGLMAKAQLEGATKKVLYGLDEMEKAPENVLNSFLSILDDQKLFKDKYYNSNIDLSKSIFVVTTNELERLKGTPIYDRIKPHTIKIKPYGLETKTAIVKQKLAKALPLNKLTDKVEIPESIYEEIAKYTTDQGGRHSTQLADKFIIQLKKLVGKNPSGKVKVDKALLDEMFKNIDLS